MKKLAILTIILSALVITSCEKDPIGMTATVNLAGEWYVNVDCVDDNGDLVYSGEDFYGIGKTILLTYNTAENVDNKMYVSDLGNFWEYTVQVDCDVNAYTFSTNGAVENEAYEDCEVTIESGKILLGAATNPHGTAADSIVFYVSFSDDPYPAYYGFAKYKISGYRYTGLVSDDE